MDEAMRFGKPPNKTDQARYRAFKAGQSIKEIAEQEGVQDKTVEFSIQRVRADNQGYTGEEVAIQVRKMLLDHLPKAAKVLAEGMEATKLVSRQVVAHDVLTGNTVQLQESIREPDHDTRLKAHSEYRGFYSVVQPRDPLVSIDQRSQTNIMTQTATPVQPNTLTSPEAVIREIRRQRGLALADGAQAAVIDAVVEEPAEADDEEDEDFEEDEEE
jgi:hypothetical protein